MSEETNYGPLKKLVGKWKGEKGLDIAPEPDGTEENSYYETLIIEEAGDVTNAEEQTLAVLRYHQVVRRKKNDKIFHDEVGYWMWDEASKTVMHSLAIPRGVCVLAGGTYADEDELVIDVKATTDDGHWNIVQSPFMSGKAKTVSFVHHITVKGDTLSYKEVTGLEIYGKAFEHIDSNELVRV